MGPIESRILDSFERTGVYIVRPGTYEILYLNNMMRSNWKGSAVGKTCYLCFGLNKPCTGCPMEEAKIKKTCSTVLFRENRSLQYDITCTQMQWQDESLVYALCFNQHIFTEEERARQKTERRLSLILRNTCDILTQINLKTGEYIQDNLKNKRYPILSGQGDYSAFFERFVTTCVHPDDQQRVLTAFRLTRLRAEAADLACDEGAFCRYHMLGGKETVWCESRAVYLREGAMPLAFIITKDITAEKKLEALAKRNDQLERERLDDERYRIILQQTQTIVVEYHTGTGERYISPFMAEYLSGNYDQRELLEIWTQDQVIHPEDEPKLRVFFTKILSPDDICNKAVIRLRSKNGAFRWFKLISSKIKEDSGGGLRMILTINDVHTETESQRSLRYRAEYDTLTGAFNRETFYIKAYELLHENTPGPFFIVRLDIDRFKVVNDLFGTQKGDLLLCFIADSIRRQVTGAETFGRISNDIFCMCLSRKKEEVLKLVHTLMNLLDAYPLSFKITPSFGIYEVENRDTPVDIMCDWANLALKTVKGSYLSRFAFYDDNMRLNLLREQQIITEMHGAMESGQFQMYLQPKYNIGSSSVIGSEALVRWQHPRNGLIPPGDFIPLFEKNGLILDLDRYIWECACRTLRRWLDEGKPPLPISVNVSRMHLYNPYLCDNLTGLIKKYGLPPRLLELELTESAYTENPKLLYETMHTLQEQGFVFLMDDFGSGYSSLNMLKDIPVDILKIDMNFLKDTEHSEQGRIILESTILMAQRLRLQVIAEGVETQEQAMFLFNAGCNKAQGYYYSRPVSVADYEQLVYEKG